MLWRDRRRLKPASDFNLLLAKFNVPMFPSSRCQFCKVSIKFPLKFKWLRWYKDFRLVTVRSRLSLKWTISTLGRSCMLGSITQMSLLPKSAVITLLQLWSNDEIESWIESGRRICWTFWTRVLFTIKFVTVAFTASQLTMFCGTIPQSSRKVTAVNGDKSKVKVEARMFDVPIGLMSCWRNSSFDEKSPVDGTTLSDSSCEQKSRICEKSNAEFWSSNDGQGRRRRDEIAWSLREWKGKVFV